MGGLVSALLSVLFTFVAQGAPGSRTIGLVACCLPAIVGALVGVWHYTSNNSVTMEIGGGAKLGALTGVVGGLVGGVIGLLFRLIGVLPGAEEQMEMARQGMLDQGMTEAQIEQGLKFSEMFMGPLGQVLGLVVGMLVFAIVGAIGGMIASAIFKKGSGRPAEA
jgi:hypothetical protein